MTAGIAAAILVWFHFSGHDEAFHFAMAGVAVAAIWALKCTLVLWRLRRSHKVDELADTAVSRRADSAADSDELLRQ
jgi:hypothetical protein